MHELSLVQSLMEQLQDLATENKATKIITVTMEIGPLAGVVIDSFEFAFEALAKDNPLTTKAKLVISKPAISYSCLDCQHVVDNCQERPSLCPACQAPHLYPDGGDQLILSRIEME